MNPVPTPSAERMPVLFLSHGAPDMVIREHPARRVLESLGAQLPRPRAVLCISPHWMTPGLCISDSAAPETLHDFWGFDPSLYLIRYPAPGAPELARSIADGLEASGVACGLQQRGYDHGVWSLMLLLYPQADIPIISLSLPAGLDAPAYAELGQQLQGWREQGVLIVASGTSTHNLRALAPEGTPPQSDYVAFQDWLLDRLAAGDREALMDWQQRAPCARLAHPSSEHLDPLWIALGAAGQVVPQVLYQGFSYGNIGLVHLRFD